MFLVNRAVWLEAHIEFPVHQIIDHGHGRTIAVYEAPVVEQLVGHLVRIDDAHLLSHNLDHHKRSVREAPLVEGLPLL